jgi:hypothetical protein
MQLSFRFFSAAALFSLVSLVAIGASDRAEAGGGSRPIHGTGEGVVTGVVSPVNLLIDYVGNATHLGNFTRHEDVTFGPFGTIAGTIVFVAANGDQLNADFTGQFISPNDAVATYTFNGGTGRFSDATGTAQAVASTPDFVHVSVSFEGTIDY